MKLLINGLLTLIFSGSIANAGCINDFSCDFGEKCLKPEGGVSVEGICAKVVNKFGGQDFNYQKTTDWSAKVKACQSQFDCQFGESCLKKNHEIKGVCVK